MKKTVSKQTTGKIGLIGSVSIIIAAVVGVGIFFKNGGVFKNNNYNSIGVLMSWILAAIIALFTAFSYAEIVTVKGLKNKNAGLAGWGGQLVGYNFGRHLNLAQTGFYYPAKIVAMGTYASVAIFQIYFAALGYTKFTGSLIGVDDKFTTLIVMMMAICIIGAFMVANLLSNKFGSVVAKGATFIKFVPILMIILLGLIFGIKLGGAMWNNEYIKQITETYKGIQIRWSDAGQFSLAGVFKSVPAILFAFDSFLVIGNVSTQVENPDKNVPLAIVIAMIVAGTAQILITIAEITIGTGNPYMVLHAGIHAKGAYIAFVVILSVSIVTAALGVINSLSMGGIRATQALVDAKMIVGYNWASKFRDKNDKLGGFAIYGIIILVMWSSLIIPSALLNTSQIYDGFSTLAVLFFFAFYGIVILGGLVNRKTNKHEIHKVGYFVPFGIIAVIGCFFTFAYCFIYQFGIQAFGHPLATTANSFGFAMVKEGYRDGQGFYNWQAAIVFWSAAVAFLAFPFINDIILVAKDRNYPLPLIWETQKKYQRYSFANNVNTVNGPVAVAEQAPAVAVEEQAPVAAEPTPVVAEPVSTQQPESTPVDNIEQK